MQFRTQPIRVMLIDCRPLVLMGLHDLINARKPRMEVCGQASTYAHALDLADQLRPNVIFFSFFPDALDPLDVISLLTRRDEMKVLLLRGLYEAVPIARAIDAFNTVNKQEASKAGARYVGVTALSREAPQKPDWLAADGLHPSGAMYRAWVERLKPEAVAALKPAP